MATGPLHMTSLTSTPRAMSAAADLSWSKVPRQMHGPVLFTAVNPARGWKPSMTPPGPRSSAHSSFHRKVSWKPSLRT